MAYPDEGVVQTWLDALRGLRSPMHLICVHPTRIDCLFSDFKELGCSTRQTLLPDAE